MSGNVVTLTGAAKTLVHKRPVGKLKSRAEPCAVETVWKSQDKHLEALSDFITGILTHLLLTLPIDQAEAQIDHAVSLGKAEILAKIEAENE